MNKKSATDLNRRKFLKTGLVLAGGVILPDVSKALPENLGVKKSGSGLKSKSAFTNAAFPGRRKIGTLDVSSIGLGVQNMSRTYQTTIPSRTEMFNIIRTAFDRGVTFYDAAEAYGPHEVERILGEGIAPFRDKVVIASKFGWNIDLETGERRQGLTVVQTILYK